MALLEQIFGDDRPHFRVYVGVVITTNPYTHVYGLTPYPVMEGTPLIPAIALGARGNSETGVQVNSSYYLYDLVLYTYQENFVAAGLTSIAFIIGRIQQDFIALRDLSDAATPTRWDGENLGAEHFKFFQDSETYQQLTALPASMLGHGGVDMLPGDWEVAGRTVSLLVGDYFAGIRATCAEHLVSGIDRRIISRSMLKTTTTVNSLDDIAIFNKSTITTHKSCGNVDDAWYNTLEETETDIKSKDAPAQYRDITQSGDVLYGEHRVILAQDHTTPLYTDFLGLDGTRKTFSATRMILGKRPGLKSIGYKGQRLTVDDSQNSAYPDTTNLDNPLTLKADDNWWEYPQTLELELNGYPDSFVDGSLGEYPDKSSKAIADNLVEDGAIPLTPGCGYIEFQDDGGIKILDAWGSYILMSHGNIEIHAMNNLFMLSARDTLSFAGANRTDYANEDISVQAYNGELRLKSGTYLRMRSGNDNNNMGSIVLEAPGSISLLSNMVDIEALEVSITCKNPLTSGSNLGGVFQVLAPAGFINLTAESIRQNASTISLTSDTAQKALVIGSAITVVGDIMLHGGLHSWRKNPTISIVTRDGKVINKPFTCGTYRRWTNEMEGIHVAGGVRAVQDIISTQSVVGGYVWTLRQQKDLETVRNPGMILSSTRSFASEYKPNINFTTSIVVADQQDLDNKYFTFGRSSQACVYRVVTHIPEGTQNPNKGFKPVSGKTRELEYIYPGTEFWRSNGVKDYTVNTEGVPKGFITIPSATDNKKG